MLNSLKSFGINCINAISDKDIASIEHAKQFVSDCYLISTLEALSHTANGQKILKNQIQYDSKNPNIINCFLYNSKGEKEKYSVPADIAQGNYEKLYKIQPNKIIRSLDISIAEFEKRHKTKPWICRLTGLFREYKFENNLPSLFMKTLTGIEPRVIAEKNFNINLTGYKKEVMELLARIEKEPSHSFILGTGIKKFNNRRWHVYVLQDVNLKNNTITVKEKRSNQPQIMDIDTALKTFKYIAGYFNSDLDTTVHLHR